MNHRISIETLYASLNCDERHWDTIYLEKVSEEFDGYTIRVGYKTYVMMQNAHNYLKYLTIDEGYCLYTVESKEHVDLVSTCERMLRFDDVRVPEIVRENCKALIRSKQLSMSDFEGLGSDDGDLTGRSIVTNTSPYLN